MMAGCEKVNGIRYKYKQLLGSGSNNLNLGCDNKKTYEVIQQ